MNDYIKRVASVHDISGFGRCSQTVIIPILSSMGVQVCPLITSLLSAHTGFDNYEFVDFTEHIEPFFNHWKKLNIEFDAIYTGFLGSSKQIAIVSKFIDLFKKENNFVVVDPVFADYGKIYSAFNEDIVIEMRNLIKKADIIVPNITEASFLLGKPMRTSLSIDEIKEWLLALSLYGPKIVIITSVGDENDPNVVCNVAYDRAKKEFIIIKNRLIPCNYTGTGDTFTSVILGDILQGETLPMSLNKATNFIVKVIERTYKNGTPPREGIFLEAMLSELSEKVIPSYSFI